LTSFGRTVALGSTQLVTNEYQEFFLVGKGGQSVRLTTLSPFASCHEIWEPQPTGTLRARPSLYRGLLYLILTYRTAWLFS